MTGQSLGPPLHLGESRGTVVASPWERLLVWPAGRPRRRRRVRADRCSRSWLAEGRARGPVFPSSRVRREAQGAAGVAPRC